ncbi:DUF4252 domain-containing protein [Subsaximicrobium wynnwilliamsii]|jgi:hypothetical protein|uniref:DUF4252 domain-containing protein n=1 Tax=Subsaximicrobium wynnwilliamsii TaxID=291179 RepID=A0A5C6ZJI4_9FLAO|nr:DUF4252 domain-containing protein [Subsaximicrobium wynnwilliamsii]TXD84704.1 DUF4252 domain-containing protein [Subsaximicrobium wynnwilliamsii]TXD90374.1 DUF4252 domain-containing protein [Subsaximicrobium wynnwilliamsii]TXE04850.1 DUF4252 domain-containing protein [Subsaximicrobium wynnwilliamsii]
MALSTSKILVLLILVVTLQSCDQEPTLQSFYVDNELSQGFTSLDVPVSMLKIDEDALTETQKEAYESVEKLSMIAFVLDETNKAEYEIEFAKVQTILKNPKYEELMRGGNTTDGKFQVSFVGKEDSVEEFVLLGNSNEKGFALVRVLGDDMNLDKIMKLSTVLSSADMDSSQLEEFMGFFK